MTYYAHTGTKPDRSDWQELRIHLRSVAELARSFAVAACPSNNLLADAAYAAGLLHDLGKYRDEFTRYLMAGGTGQRSAETAHAMYGAAAASFEFKLQLAAFVIAGHHAGLHDISDLQQLLEGRKFLADRRYPALLQRAQDPDELGPLPAVDPIPFHESDAVQARQPTLDVLCELHGSIGASFLFCSATRPAFHRTDIRNRPRIGATRYCTLWRNEV